MKHSIHHLLAGIPAGAAVLPSAAADEPEAGQVPPHPIRMDRKIPVFPGAWGGGETSGINLINNYHKPGSAAKEGMVGTSARIGPGVRKMYSPGSEWAAGDWYPETPARPKKRYLAGNMVEGRQVPAREAFESELSEAGATSLRRDPADVDGDGHTNLEEYINRTSPRAGVDYLNLGSNVDTAS